MHLAAAYFSIAKRLEQKTNRSQPRGFIISTLRGRATLNQNQIANLLGFEGTVAYRAIKVIVREASGIEAHHKFQMLPCGGYAALNAVNLAQFALTQVAVWFALRACPKSFFGRRKVTRRGWHVARPAEPRTSRRQSPWP